MSIGRPISGNCAAHPALSAQWACQRCGSFVCPQCERRTRPEAPPLCPACWELRSQTIRAQTVSDSKRLQIGGLVLGALSFLHPLIMVGSAVVNIRELARGTGGSHRWMNGVGIALTVLAIITWVVGFSILASS